MQIVTYFQLNEKFILAGEGKGYCYMSINCQGRHVEGTASLLKSECCDGMNGVAWGKAGEDKCFPCETSNPILRGVVSKWIFYDIEEHLQLLRNYDFFYHFSFIN